MFCCEWSFLLRNTPVSNAASKGSLRYQFTGTFIMLLTRYIARRNTSVHTYGGGSRSSFLGLRAFREVISCPQAAMLLRQLLPQDRVSVNPHIVITQLAASLSLSLLLICLCRILSLFLFSLSTSHPQTLTISAFLSRSSPNKRPGVVLVLTVF